MLALRRRRAPGEATAKEFAAGGFDQLTIDVPRVRWTLQTAVALLCFTLGLPGLFEPAISGLWVVIGAVATGGILAEWHGRRRHGRAGLDAVIAAALSGGVAAYLWFATVVVPSNGGAVDWDAGPTVGSMVLVVLVALTAGVLISARRRRRWSWVLTASTAVMAGLLMLDVVGDVRADELQVLWLVMVVIHVGSLARLTLDTSVPYLGRRQGGVGLDTVALAAAGVLAGPIAAFEQTIMDSTLRAPLVIVGATLFPVLSITYLIRQVHDRAIAELEAHHDTLTGLLTRALFLDRLEVAMARARRRGGRLAVVFVDLDEFKEVNDSFGHDAGDLVLTRVARRITDQLRDEDSVARIGGDEFLVLLPEIESTEGVEAVGRKLLESIRRPIQFGTVDLWPSASVGTAMFPDHAQSANDLLEKADTSMYQAKKLGRGRVQMYSEDLAFRSRLRQWLERELRIAIETGALGLDFQPVVDINDEVVVAFEAQPRWDHPDLGVLPSDVFVPLVEDAGLIGGFVDHMLARTCERAARWRGQGLVELPIAFKVSRRQITSAQILSPVLRALMRSDLPPRLLELELSEETLTINRDAVQRMMTELRSHGLRCIVEDFGMGNAGIGYLTQLPLAGIKIDRKLVAEIGMHATPPPVIEAIAALAGALNTRVAAEGVTTVQQFNYLRGSGCTILQGDLLCPPVDEEDLEARLLGASLVRGRTSMAPLLLRELEAPTGHEPVDARVVSVLRSLTGTENLDPAAVDHVLARIPATIEA